MTTNTSTLQKQIFSDIQSLPNEALEELSIFLDYLHFKVDQKSALKTPYQPVKMGGALKNTMITDEDLIEIRKEMWGNFGDLNL